MKLRFLICFLLISQAVGVYGTEDKENEQKVLPLDDLQLFVQIFDQIRNSYVEEIDDSQLFEQAINGMLQGLDPHSVYLKEESFEDLQINTSGEFGGLGIEVGMENGFVKVIAPIDDSPAKKAGIRAGDLIIKLDDQVVRGLNLSEAIELMRGEKGEAIKLTILRESEDAPFDVDIVRGIIKLQSVRSEIIDEHFGYIRIAQFQKDTGKQFNAAIDKIREDSTIPLKGVVLDLRNNPGGLLPSSIDVADSMLDSGLIVYTEGRIATANSEFRAQPGDKLTGLPIVAIINNGSASASEIVAGALQDNQRAIIIGTQSFGKGSVQTVMPLREDKAIKLTTARYFTPSGHSIQARGIVPDIVVEPAEIKVFNQRKGVSEANLARHLKNDDPEISTEMSKPSSHDDNQLFEAINILKGIAIYQQ